MRVTKLLVVLAAIGIGVLLFAIKFPGLLEATGVYDLVLLGATIADFLSTPKPAAIFDIRRINSPELSLAAHNKVTVFISRKRDPLLDTARMKKRAVVVRDYPPDEFAVTGSTEARVIISEGEDESSFSYFLVPHRQGDYRFQNTYALLTGPLSLIQRFSRISTTSDIKVYPNLQETEKYDLLARKGLLMQLGIRSMRMRGAGSEFESLREYVIGDEYRKIDWPATARKGKLITRQYNVEKSQNILLVLDCGRNMLQQVQKMTKLDFAMNTALMLGYVAASQDDKVGLVAFDAEVKTFIPPAKGKAQVFRLLSALYNMTAQMVESDYRAGFLEILSRWQRRSLVVFFTDLIDPESSTEILAAISLAANRHRVLCVTVSDPTIIAAASIDPQTPTEAYKKSVALQVLQERKSAISLMKRRNVWTIDSPPEALSADLINHYLELKARSAF